MKKFLVGIATFMTIAVLCIISAGAETYGDYSYSVLNNGTIEIIDYTGSATELTIPSVIDRKNVTSIGSHAFDKCRSLTSVTIPDSVTNIGSYAFELCTSLTSITIPGSVTSISERAFSECSSLTSVTIPDGVTSIGVEAFESCVSLASVTIPDSVTSIGGNAFIDTALMKNQTTYIRYVDSWVVDCDKSVTGTIAIKDGTTGIADYSFDWCNFDAIIIPDGVINIGSSAFENCWSITSISIPDSVTSIGGYAFYWCSSLTSVTIPDSVTSIGGSAFEYCASLTSITIPDSVTSIGSWAFSSCSSLTSITIPDSVTSIGYGAFNGCNNLVINCYENSVAHQYAIDNNIKYVLLSKVEAPAAIDNFKSGSRSANAVTISWSANNNATGYIIQQYKNNAWTNIANIKDNATTSYKISGLAANTTYKFRAVAYVTKDGTTTYSNYTSALTVSTAPAQTAGFAITGRGSNFLTITWKKNTGASGYVIQEQINGVWTKVVAIKGNETTSYKITGLRPNSFHRYRMVAYKTDANGTCYGKYTGSVPGYTAPAVVSGFKVSVTTSDSLTISWDKVTYANGYVIDIYKDGKWSQLAKISSNATASYKASGLAAGTQYKFRIKSYATNGSLTINSTYSSAISGVTALSKVENLRMTNRGSDFISVKWDKSESTTGYMVYLYDGTSWKCIKTLTSSSAVSHKITGLESGRAYKVTVKAYKIISGTRCVSDSTTISAVTL